MHKCDPKTESLRNLHRGSSHRPCPLDPVAGLYLESRLGLTCESSCCLSGLISMGHASKGLGRWVGGRLCVWSQQHLPAQGGCIHSLAMLPVRWLLHMASLSVSTIPLLLPFLFLPQPSLPLPSLPPSLSLCTPLPPSVFIYFLNLFLLVTESSDIWPQLLLSFIMGSIPRTLPGVSKLRASIACQWPLLTIHPI